MLKRQQYNRQPSAMLIQLHIRTMGCAVADMQTGRQQAQHERELFLNSTISLSMQTKFQNKFND